MKSKEKHRHKRRGSENKRKGEKENYKRGEEEKRKRRTENRKEYCEVLKKTAWYKAGEGGRGKDSSKEIHWVNREDEEREQGNISIDVTNAAVD